MISGVIAQGTTLPRGALAVSRAYFDFESIASPRVVSADSQIASSGLYTDVDGFFATRSSRALLPAFKIDDGAIFAPRLRQSQVLQPALYVAADVFLLPTVALPGILQTHFIANDDIAFSPFVSTHGSLRPALYNALDTVYAPSLVTAQTLLLNSVYNAADSVFAPTVRLNWIFARFLSDADVYYTPFIHGPFATFDGVPLNVTLSGGNLTATHTTTTTGGARSTFSQTTGKYFFEIIATSISGNNDAMGLLTSSGSYSDIVNLATNCTVVLRGNSGSIYSNNTNTGKQLGTIASGSVVCVAVDLGARLGWFRKNGGDWNGDPTADPATGVGGVTIGAGAFAPAIAFGGSGSASTNAMTVNFGQSAYVYAAPAGFGFWFG